MAESTPKSYSTDPALYLYTSLTSGSSQIVTATSRLETILKANRIPFKAIDIATDEKARMLWGRRSGKDEAGRSRKIPGLVQTGLVIGDLVEIEEWNEYGELKEHVTIYHEGGAPAKPEIPNLLKKSTIAPVSKENTKSAPAGDLSSKHAESPKPPAGAQPTSFTLAMRQAGQEAAQKAKEAKSKITETFTGVGKAESEEQGTQNNATAHTPIPIPDSFTDKGSIIAPTILQSPTSTAWKLTAKPNLPTTTADDVVKESSLQFPDSTSRKPASTDVPATSHRGSSISTASKEEIQQIEKAVAIPEEDEDEDGVEEAVQD